jgi:hypothetical protein
MTQTLYTVTAANAYFWQNLAVRADSRQKAYDLFRAYLAEKSQQDGEEYEWEAGKAIADAVSEPTDRECYVYSVDYQGVEFVEDDEIQGYTGEIEQTVVMTNSGGNG